MPNTWGDFHFLIYGINCPAGTFNHVAHLWILCEVDPRLFSYLINRKVLNYNKVLQVERKTL
jgi:hypothetical protein